PRRPLPTRLAPRTCLVLSLWRGEVEQYGRLQRPERRGSVQVRERDRGLPGERVPRHADPSLSRGPGDGGAESDVRALVPRRRLTRSSGERQFDDEPRAITGPARQREPAAERLHPVGKPAQAGAGVDTRSTPAVVADRDDERVTALSNVDCRA